MRYQRARVFLYSILPFLLLNAALLQANTSKRPNLVLIIADDATYLDLEVYGGQAKTPHLNRLASEGMQFSRCFQSAPMCSPTRHNIYTGIYPVKSGAWPNHTCVYPGTKSIAHYLKAAGYRVALSGKTHISPPESFPFEYSQEFKTADPSQSNPYPKLDRLIAESLRDENPFCLIACSNEPHTPYTKGDSSAYPIEQLKLPPTWVDTVETRENYAQYLAEITYFDQQCGALLQLLEKHGVANDTLVMVVSEQGSAFPFAKWTCYELGLSSGMIARWPGTIESGSRSDALVEYCDITPTFLEAAGESTPKTMDGTSFLPVLQGKRLEHKRYTFGVHTTRGIINGTPAYGVRSAATKEFRYIRNLHHKATFTNAVTREKGDNADFWTSWVRKAESGDAHAEQQVAKYQNRPAEELYHTKTDPHCENNLIDFETYASVRSELSNQLDRWMTSQGDLGSETEWQAHLRTAKYQRKQRQRQSNNSL